MSYEKVQWNTKRQYSEHGQRIVALPIVMLEHKGIVFEDLDRHIGGFIELVRLPELDSEVQEVTMFNYDRGNYRMVPLEVQRNTEKLTWK
jgi:hypothetical protein